jgi:hypothetical protein
MGGEVGSRVGDVEATSKVRGDVRVGLEMGGQRRKGGLVVSPSAARANGRQIHGHGRQATRSFRLKAQQYTYLVPDLSMSVVSEGVDAAISTCPY